MRLIHFSALKPGMKLARDVKQGRNILLSRNSPITDKVIELFKSSGFDGKVIIEDFSYVPPVKFKDGFYRIPILERAHGIIELSGSVMVETFVEEGAILWCDGDVTVNEDILPYANIICTGNLIVKGDAIGCSLIGGVSVEVNNIGDKFGTPTMVASIDPQQKLSELNQQTVELELFEVNKKIEVIAPTLAEYARRTKKGEKIPAEEAQRIRKLILLYNQLQKLKNERLAQETLIFPIATNNILIKGMAYYDTTIRINSTFFTVADKYLNMNLRIKDGSIVCAKNKLKEKQQIYNYDS